MYHKLFYENFDDKYDNPSSLEYHRFEKNNWFYNLFKYTQCYERYNSYFTNYEDLKKELTRIDINDVCKKELENLRNAANNGLSYKEVNGFVHPFMIVDDNRY